MTTSNVYTARWAEALIWLNKAVRFVEANDGWILHPGQDFHGYLVKARAALMPQGKTTEIGINGGATRDLTFANPGSALRAANKHNPRNLPCPTCGEPDRLTPADKARGYQCDACADRAEGVGGYADWE